jgi:hypothetical protein
MGGDGRSDKWMSFDLLREEHDVVFVPMYLVCGGTS